MAINKRFLTKNGIENNNSPITDVSGISNSGDITVTRAGSTQATFGANGLNLTNNLTVQNNSARVYIDAPSGDPALQLLLNGVGNAFIGVASGDNSLISGSTAGDLCLRTTGNDMLLSANNGVSASMFVGSNDRIGIRTTSPYTTLHVRTSAVSGLTSVNNEGILIERAGGVAALNIASDNTQSCAIWFADPQSLAAGGIQYLHSNDSLTFIANATERMRIDSSGNVGIGTTNPLARLHIDNISVNQEALRLRSSNGNSRLSFVSKSDGTGFELNVAQDSDGAANKRLSILMGGNEVVRFVNGSQEFYSANNREGYLSSTANLFTISSPRASGALRFMTGGDVERLRIAADGNVGIGTSNPDGRLHLSGTTSLPAALIFERSDAAVGEKNWYQRIRANHTFDIGRTDDSGAITNTFLSIDKNGLIDINGSLTISGNLTVNGSTTTVNSTVVTIDDPIFTLGGDTAPASDDNKDRGIEFRWHNGTSAKVGFFGYDDSTGSFTFIPDATNTSEVFSGTKGSIDAFVNWTNITSKPTTLAGYGITDAVEMTDIGTAPNEIPLNQYLGRLAYQDTVPLAVSGSGLSITNADGLSGTPTVTSNATSSNVVSTLVFRDSNGDFSARNITLSGDLNSTSDATLKTNIRTSEGLSIINKLRGVTFDWIVDGKKASGVIAQEVAEVLPHVVSHNDEGKLVVAYQQLISHLIQAVNELSEEVNDLKARISQ